MNVRSDGVVVLLLRRDTEQTVKRTERFQTGRRGYIADNELITVCVQLCPQVPPTSPVGHHLQQHYVCCENSCA